MLVKSVLVLALVVACCATTLTKRQGFQPGGNRQGGGDRQFGGGNGDRKFGGGSGGKKPSGGTGGGKIGGGKPGGDKSEGKEGIGENPMSKININPEDYGKKVEDITANLLTKRQAGGRQGKKPSGDRQFGGGNGDRKFGGGSGGKKPSGGAGGGKAGGGKPGGDKSEGKEGIGENPMSKININPEDYGKKVEDITANLLTKRQAGGRQGKKPSGDRQFGGGNGDRKFGGGSGGKPSGGSGGFGGNKGGGGKPGGDKSQGKEGIGENPMSKININPEDYGKKVEDITANLLTKRDAAKQPNKDRQRDYSYSNPDEKKRGKQQSGEGRKPNSDGDRTGEAGGGGPGGKIGGGGGAGAGGGGKPGGDKSQGKAGIGENPISKINISPEDYGKKADDITENLLG